MIEDLNLPLLQQRRQNMKLIMMNRIVYKLTATPSQVYLTPVINTTTREHSMRFTVPHSRIDSSVLFLPLSHPPTEYPARAKMLHLFKNVDVERYRKEAAELLKMSLPMSLTYFLLMLPTLVSLGFCGQMGKEIGDGMELALHITTALGYIVLIGLSSAVDTLFPQIHGTGNVGEIGSVLQRSILIMLVCCLLCSAVLLNSGLCFRLIGQDAVVARIAGEYGTVLIGGLPGFGLTLLLSKYIQVKSILFPSLVIGLMVNIENFILHALFIYVLEFKIRGSAFAVVLSQWTSAILHVVLIVYKGYHTDTWKGRVQPVKIIIINMRKLIQIIQKMKVVKINSTWLT
ncbi:multidrug and toxin extrusion protein 2-like [Crassostrea angulata]|uniref:multidrug and toxin extrusion protein 2-like n=1 Tax=Magallana angulata TaxID=2784310 RepID=UPI0022B0D125|nr:multidrug and toxin extrusion protein 2-like [Crassostrea angulata]